MRRIRVIVIWLHGTAATAAISINHSSESLIHSNSDSKFINEQHLNPRNQPIKMNNTFITWSSTLLLISMCMAGDKLSIFVTKQGLDQRPMVVPSDWNVGQVVQQAIADRRLTGSWELRFGGDTLSEDTALRDSGICTESQVDLVPQFQWDLASLEDKQPIFKITFENPEFERQYGVNKLDLFVQ